MTDYVLEITLTPDLEDQVLGRLFLTSMTGSTSQGSQLTAWFDSAEAREEAMEALSDIDGIELHPADRERVDWLERYQQSLEPLLIGERFIVAPDGSLIDETNRLALIIPQEQAFGTGSHETTALCIELLETLDLRGKRGLDIGSGSGILALAMLRLGARKAIAFDNDPDAFGALRDNRARNGVKPEAMALFIGATDALRGGHFDVITMNILPEVIIDLLGRVVRHLAANGGMIVSGILTTRRDEIVHAAGRHGLALSGERERGEWWAGVLHGI